MVRHRTSANFLDWVTRTFDRDLVKKLNAAVREGRYDESLWRTWSGKSVQQLGEEWLVAQRSRLSEGH
ncbi:MAG TPA: basic secretory protein-like protein [Kiritimatiellia bacterium]|nr:basic secretory protein-like protein [Kiritimatiellia bacterium]HPS09088.1 basic secretory protein-like protein [Kiritimatiellia bacterium]